MEQLLRGDAKREKHILQRGRSIRKRGRRTAKISTEYLAEKLEISQQSASRYLIELERKSWIKKTTTPEGSLIKIDEAGAKELQKLYANLRFVVEAAYPPSVTLEGTVFTGLGEGAYYPQKEPYRKQFV